MKKIVTFVLTSMVLFFPLMSTAHAQIVPLPGVPQIEVWLPVFADWTRDTLINRWGLDRVMSYQCLETIENSQSDPVVKATYFFNGNGMEITIGRLVTRNGITFWVINAIRTVTDCPSISCGRQIVNAAQDQNSGEY